METLVRARLSFGISHRWHKSPKVFRRSIHQLDEKWLNKWAATPPRELSASEKQTRSNAPIYYQLPMFPYPSGRLHIGHLRVYAISDTLARFRRMSGYNVIHPLGWDAFGLPAENAAIEHGVNAAEWTYNHIDLMRDQLKRMMISFDWDREVITCRPDYYKQTQQIFLELYKAGLAYRKKSAVNWDPVDKTVLANEQIDSQGRSWRSGAIAEQRELEQWFLGISAFAKELESDLSLLEDWPEKVKKMQQQWIGISLGAEVKFGEDLWAFTTKIETLSGVKFVAIAEDHPLAVANAVSTTKNGLVEGVEALHPLTGEPLPVYVADYVVSGYGSGVVMGVPAHDERDQAFWERVRGRTGDLTPVIDETTVLSGPCEGLKIEDARSKLVEILEQRGSGRAATHTRLRDWLVSRQRFWGAPIPMVHCDSCGIVPVPESELPVKLPEDTKNVPLAQNKEWLETTCPECGGPAHRESDTMDTFMDSSWYFFRYLDPHNSKQPFDADKVNGIVPVDCYVGGIEHAILHLLYSRFLSKFLAKANKWDGGNLNGEPFTKLVTQGMVHGKTFRDKETGRYLKPEELDSLRSKLVSDPTAMDHLEGSMEKMSKSKFNGVDPLDAIDMHGVDATRAHMLFQAAIADTLDWNDAAIIGVKRWLGKLQTLGAQFTANGSAAGNVNKATGDNSSSEKAVKLWNDACALNAGITESLSETLSLNTVISDYMKFTKVVTDLHKLDPKLATSAYEALLKMIAPVCPAHADELWEQFKGESQWTSIHSEPWPVLKKIEERTDKCQFNVLVNSRPVKPPVVASSKASQEELLSLIDLEGKTVKRVIFRPDKRVLNVVTE